MLEQMYVACADCLTLGSQLGTAQDLPSPQVLRQRVSTQLDALRQRARELNIPQHDVNDALYALVAFIDEQILRSDWPGRQQWMAQPLQLVYFNENTAGEGFFQKLQQIQQQPERAHVLEIYYLCIALGFQGMYAVHGGDITALSDQLAGTVSRAARASDVISPHGYPEPNARRGFARRDAPVVGLAIGFLALAVVLVIILKILVGVRASNEADDLGKRVPRQVSSLSLPHGAAATRERA